jgi:hypothetical protein
MVEAIAIFAGEEFAKGILNNLGGKTGDLIWPPADPKDPPGIQLIRDELANLANETQKVQQSIDAVAGLISWNGAVLKCYQDELKIKSKA